MSFPLAMKGFCAFKRFRRVNLIGHKIFVLVFTFFIYTSYHLSRKPISVVKSALHGNSSCNQTSSPNCSNAGWSPFNGKNADELLGALDLAYLFAYAAGLFFSGHIAERTNMRNFLAIGMAASGVMTILFGCGRLWNIHSLGYYIAVQFICGIVQSSGWPPIVAIVANWFGKDGSYSMAVLLYCHVLGIVVFNILFNSRGVIFGVWNVHTYVGNILGSLIAGAVLQRFGDENWALAFIIPGIIIIVMAALTFLFLIPHPQELADYISLKENSVRVLSEQESLTNSVGTSDDIGEHDENTALIPPTECSSPPETAISIFGALRIPGVVEFSLCLFFAKLVSYTFLYWLPNYIAISEHVSSYMSAELSTMFDVGGMIGGILAGVISDLSGARAMTCILMFLIAAPSMFAYQAWATLSLGANVGFLILCGILVNGPYSLITTAVSADLGQSLLGNAKALATVSAIIDGTGSIGAAIGPVMAGVVSPTGWGNVFYVLIAADLAAMVLLFRLGLKELKNSSCCRCYRSRR